MQKEGGRSADTPVSFMVASLPSGRRSAVALAIGFGFSLVVAEKKIEGGGTYGICSELGGDWRAASSRLRAVLPGFSVELGQWG